MQAFIPAEGRGTRLHPETQHTPKPLILINNKPVLENIIVTLKKYNIDEIFISVVYLKEQIKAYFKDGSKWGCKIQYIEPEIPMGTAGALRYIKNDLQTQFIVVYCDYYINFNFQKLIDFHGQCNNSISTIVTQKFPWPEQGDHIEINQDNIIQKFISRPHAPNLKIANRASTGIYVCNKSILEHMSLNSTEQYFEKDLFPNALRDNQNLYSYFTEEYIEDMGSHERREKVKYDILTDNLRNRNSNDFPDYAYT